VAPVRTEEWEVAVIGAGPAGLRAATELARSGSRVVVLDRESELGGIPRHCNHTGYGMRDLYRFMSGPAYARIIVDKATSAGAMLRANNMVTGWNGGQLEVTSPQGRYALRARAIVLATGARERPRPARLIPGDRSAGIYTTGQLQNLVYVQHREVGTRAVIVGAELVSWSATLTLRHAGCKTVMMTTEYPKADAYTLFSVPGRAVLGVDVATETRVVRVVGRPRVTGVEIEDIPTRTRKMVACDTVIFTGDWIADHELARLAGLEMDAATTGPRVDGSLRTSAPGIFAAGNLVHPVETADCAALSGAHVAAAVADYLSGVVPPRDEVDLVANAPFRWVSPSKLRIGDRSPARGRLLFWCDEYVSAPTVVATQDGREVGRVRLLYPAAPGRMFRVPATMLRGFQPGIPVRFGIA
jgi:thioredoxin reductase